MLRWRTILVALGGLSLLVSCGDAETPLSGAPRAAVAPPVAPPASAAATPAADFHYDSTNRRDPFRSFVAGLYGAVDEGPASPLERFDLSQLTLMAIIWGMDAPKALIRDPAGKGYVVSEGAVIGKNKGRIVSIGDNLVLVKETYVDHLDRATTKAVEMRLRETQESDSQGG